MVFPFGRDGDGGGGGKRGVTVVMGRGDVAWNLIMGGTFTNPSLQMLGYSLSHSLVAEHRFLIAFRFLRIVDFARALHSS